MTPPADRQVPVPVEAEKAVVGALLNSPSAIGDIMATGLRPEMVVTTIARSAFTAMLEMEAEGQPIDPLTVADYMRRTGWTDQSSDLSMDLFHIAQQSYTTANADYYAGIIVEAAQRRNLSSIGTRLVQYAPDASYDVGTMAEEAMSALEGESAATQSGQPEVLGSITEDALTYYENRSDTLVLTGYPSLDELTGGLGGGQTIIIAARPGVGKSTAALDIARKVAFYDGPAMFFSMEMSKREVTARAISAESGVDLTKIMRGTTSERDKDTIAATFDRLDQMRLYIDDSAGLTITEIQTKARKQARSPEGLRLVVVDYIGLLKAVRDYESRQVEVSAHSRALKQLALELDIPIIVVAQLNRGAMEDDRAKLSDLRESGALEQDADKVIMISRNRETHDTTVSVAKNRAGELGDIPLVPQLWRARFTDPGPESSVPYYS